MLKPSNPRRMGRVWLLWSGDLKDFLLVILVAIILSIYETAPAPLVYYFMFILGVHSLWVVTPFPIGARGFYFGVMFYGFILLAQLIYAVSQNLGVSNRKLIDDASMLEVMPSILLILIAMFLLVLYLINYRSLRYGLSRFSLSAFLLNSSACSFLVYGLFVDFDFNYLKSVPTFPDIYYHVLFGCLSVMGVGVFLHSVFGGVASAKQ